MMIYLINYILLNFHNFRSFDKHTSKHSRYFFYTFKDSVHFLQAYTFVYFVFMPDWPDKLDNLLFFFSIIGNVNLFDVVCLFPSDSNHFFFIIKKY